MQDEHNLDVVVAVCTYNRNDELNHLITKMIEYSRAHWRHLTIGMTIIDDSLDGNARSVAEQYTDSFPLGLVYENSASRNISTARNLALTRSMYRARWIAMTDDDCEPSADWLAELVRVAEVTAADVSSGLMLRRVPPHAPSWIKTQPFLELGEFSAADGEEMAIANTNNCLISSAFLIANPSQRFDPDFGRIGGEDMAFFRSLKASGAKLVFAAKAFVYENEPDERLTIRYQMRRYFWHGNSSVITSLHSGASRPRLAVHAGATMARAIHRPVVRIVKGTTPQLLYAAAQFAEGLGKLTGVFGIRVKHK